MIKFLKEKQNHNERKKKATRREKTKLPKTSTQPRPTPQQPPVTTATLFSNLKVLQNPRASDILSNKFNFILTPSSPRRLHLR